jgi:hypothetical protein
LPPIIAKIWKWRWQAWLLLLGAAIAFLVAYWSEIATFLKAQFPGKTRWDYIEKIIIPATVSIIPPVAIAYGVFFLDRNAKNRERERDENSAKERERIRLEESKTQSLQLYFDRISAVLLEKQAISLARAASRLGPAYKDPIVESAKHLVRAQTLAILRTFSADNEKKSSVMRFLIESEVLASLYVSLCDANLSGANLRGADLSFVDLERADLTGADLSGADLTGANLIEAKLVGCKLIRTGLQGANMAGATLINANLEGANLTKATLIRANLHEAKLVGAYLSAAELMLANLNGARLTSAYLCGASLSGANLSGANLHSIEWDESTKWPVRQRFWQASRMPEDLRKQLGL